MLWSGKLFIVGVTVVAYAMVRIDVNSGYRRLDKQQSDKKRTTLKLTN